MRVVTDEEIDDCLVIIAELLPEHPRLLPVFERFEREQAARRNATDAMARARALVAAQRGRGLTAPLERQGL